MEVSKKYTDQEKVIVKAIQNLFVSNSSFIQWVYVSKSAVSLYKKKINFLEESIHNYQKISTIVNFYLTAVSLESNNYREILHFFVFQKFCLRKTTGFHIPWNKTHLYHTPGTRKTHFCPSSWFQSLPASIKP